MLGAEANRCLVEPRNRRRLRGDSLKAKAVGKDGHALVKPSKTISLKSTVDIAAADLSGNTYRVWRDPPRW